MSIDADQIRRSALPLGSRHVCIRVEDLEALLAEVVQLRTDLASAQAVVKSLAARVAAQSEVLSRRTERRN